MLWGTFIISAMQSRVVREFVWSFVEDCNLEGESWEPVVDKNNTVVFKVSNLGRLQYANNNNKTFGHKTAGGYRFWYLRNNYAVHHLICQVFHGAKPTSAHTVDHINRDPFDNKNSLNFYREFKMGDQKRTSPKQEHSTNRTWICFEHRNFIGYLAYNNRCSSKNSKNF